MNFILDIISFLLLLSETSQTLSFALNHFLFASFFSHMVFEHFGKHFENAASSHIALLINIVFYVFSWGGSDHMPSTK